MSEQEIKINIEIEIDKIITLRAVQATAVNTLCNEYKIADCHTKILRLEKQLEKLTT